jgi:hypothetical protein
MLRISLIAAGLLSSGVAAGADGIPIEPGLWEMTSTMHMPMLPQPQVNTVQECIEKSVISVDELQGEEMDPNCSFEMEQVDDKTMKWSFDCPVEGGGTSHGEWQATSHGDRVQGGGTISMNVQGQAMEMTMNWVGQRIGACP